MIFSLILAAASLPNETLIPFETLARGPAISAVAISPGGKRVATIEMKDGRASIFEGNIDGDRRLIYRDSERSIDNVRWSADGKWLYFLQDSGGDEGYHLFRLDPAYPNEAKDLTPFSGITAELVATPPGYAGSVLVAMNKRDPQYPDVYAVDLRSGQITEIFRNQANYTEFFADRQGDIRAAGRIMADGTLELWGRESTAATLRLLYSAPAQERFKALAIHNDGRSVIVKSNRKAQFERASLVSFSDGQVRRMPDGACGNFDLDSIIQDQSGPMAALCTHITSDIIPLNRAFRKDVQSARKFLHTDSISFESRSHNGEATMLYSDASDRPGRFILVRNGKTSVFAETRPELAAYRFAQSKAFRMRARDGLPLLGYVTRPIGQNKAGPTIVAVHGGPWTRDAAAFERETQFYVNRGYTVIQVNFRGSTGLGKHVFEGGIGEFGAKMSDDVDDAVLYAVRKGWTDASHVCILGGSYGGFAALTAISRVGKVRYRCAVAYAGPSDLETLMRAFPPSWKPFLPRSWYRFVGNPDVPKDAERMRERSPLTHVDNMQVPLLIFQGANDPRVRQDQSDRIVCSLRNRRIDVDYLLAGNEGHSFANEETSLALTRATEEFFGRHLGGQIGTQTTAAAQEALTAFREAGMKVQCPS